MFSFETFKRGRSHLLQGLCLLGLLSPSLSQAQTAEDGIMLAKQQLCTGVFFSYDYWDHYWEGALNYTPGNGNLGTVTTRSVFWTGNYAINNRLDVIATVPYVWTAASQGVLHPQSGFQDFSLTAKYKLISIPVKKYGAVRAIVVATGTVPMSNYTPDLEPLSIGTQSSTITGRGTLNYLGKNGLYINGSTAYTFRGNVTLDRSLLLHQQPALPQQPGSVAQPIRIHRQRRLSQKRYDPHR